MRLIDSLSGIRTSLRQHVHSLPPSHRSSYLERHMLAKQRERLEREIAVLERRRQQCRQQVADIEAQMETLAGKKEARKQVSLPPASRDGGPGRVATMTVEY